MGLLKFQICNTFLLTEPPLLIIRVFESSHMEAG